jgi:hydrogenase maturation protease
MNASPKSPVLVIGYGNPGRLDDGLGPALAEALAEKHLPGVTVDSDYQLTVEDAAEVARHERVVFVDADVSGAEPFTVRRVYPGASPSSFTSHSVTPGAVVTLAAQLFRAEPEVYVMGIRGYEFNEFGERLSDGARANLDAALDWLETALRHGTLDEVRANGPDRTSQ